MAFNATDLQEQKRKAVMMSRAQEEMRAMQLQSSLRNAALLQRLQDLEEKVKESSLKTEHLRLLREEARTHAREAAQNSKPPLPRKARQVHFEPLTSTPYRSQPIRKGSAESNMSMLDLGQRFPNMFPKRGLMRNSKNTSMEHLKYLRDVSKLSDYGTTENSMEKSTILSFTHGYNDHQSNILRFNPRMQRKIENCTNSAEIPSDIAATPGCSSLKQTSQQREDFYETSEEMTLEELTSDDEPLSDEEHVSNKTWEENPSDAQIVATNILENEAMETKMSVVSNEIMTKSKLSDTIEIQSQMGFLPSANLNAMQENPLAEEASIGMKAKTDIEVGHWTKPQTQPMQRNSIKKEMNTAKTENKLSSDIPGAEIEMYSAVPEAEEISEIRESEETSKMPRTTDILVEDSVSEIHEITTKALLTSEEIEETPAELVIPKPAEFEIQIKVEQWVEPGIEGSGQKLIAKNEAFDERNLENKSISKNATNANDLKEILEIPGADNSYNKTEIVFKQQTPMTLKAEHNSEKQNARPEDKTTGGFLSFLSSDDDDEEDSFFDSIPKPHASVVQEIIPEPQLKIEATRKPEEMSDTQSDDADSDIDQQLANLVTSTVPIRFVEHEMAQSEQDLKKEESSPSKIPQTNRTAKDVSSEMSQERGLTSQPNQKLHQKLAMHLGLDSDTKTTFKASESDLKKVEDKVEEDDFDFYD